MARLPGWLAKLISEASTVHTLHHQAPVSSATASGAASEWCAASPTPGLHAAGSQNRPEYGGPAGLRAAALSWMQACKLQRASAEHTADAQGEGRCCCSCKQLWMLQRHVVLCTVGSAAMGRKCLGCANLS